MNRAVDIWQGPVAVAARRLLALLVRGFIWLLARVLWQLRVLWATTSPRMQIILILVGLVLLSAWTGSSIPGLSEIARGLAVLLLAFIGFWWILTAPFQSRRWW